MKNLKYLSLVITLMLVTSTGVNAQFSYGGSDWTVTPTVPSEAGLDYNLTSFESDASQILVTADFGFGLLWLLGTNTIAVSYQADPLWHNDLKLEVQRTGDGSFRGCFFCAIGGSKNVYKQIYTSPAVGLYTLYPGVSLGGESRNVPIQIRLSGVSVTVPAANYSAKIVFTISN